MSLDITQLTLENLPERARARLEKAAQRLGTSVELVFENFKAWLQSNEKTLSSFYRITRDIGKALILATNAFIIQILRKRPGTSKLTGVIVGVSPSFPTKKDPTSKFARLLVVTRDEANHLKFDVAIVKGMNIDQVISQLELFQVYELDAIKLKTGGYLIDDSAEVKLVAESFTEFLTDEERNMIEQVKSALLDWFREKYQDNYDEAILDEPVTKLSLIYYLFLIREQDLKIINVAEASQNLSRPVDEFAGWVDPTDLRIVHGMIARKNRTIIKGCETLILEISDPESCLQEVTVESLDSSLSTLTVWAHPVHDRYGRNTDALFIGTINMSRKTNLPMMSLYTIIPIVPVLE